MHTRPFTVLQHGVYLFVIHAYSLRQVRALVTARLSNVSGVTIAKGSAR
jgi:hypothetical protein